MDIEVIKPKIKTLFKDIKPGEVFMGLGSVKDESEVVYLKTEDIKDSVSNIIVNAIKLSNGEPLYICDEVIVNRCSATLSVESLHI
jgi:hypothetical protein